jgi:hypothetical protein
VYLAVLEQCFPWEVIIEPVVELHAACSKTLNYLKACLLQIAVAGAGLNLSSMRPIFGVAYEFLFEEIRVLLKFNSKFPACHLSMAIPSYGGASRLRNFTYCSS